MGQFSVEKPVLPGSVLSGNQQADVTFIPMACGFLYLVAIIDWASRAVLAWRLSNTNDARFCAAALEEALLRFGKPRIFNTDSQRIEASFWAA